MSAESEAKLATTREFIDAGFEVNSVILAVTAGDISLLRHTGRITAGHRPKND